MLDYKKSDHCFVLQPNRLTRVLVSYLDGKDHVSAPKWTSDALKARCEKTYPPFRMGNKVDAGGRPI